MCGRYSIYESMDHYLKELVPKQLVINGYELWLVERYNVGPSMRVEIIRPVREGLNVNKVKWGWAPFWAKGKRPDPINARFETVITASFSTNFGQTVVCLPRRTVGSNGSRTKMIQRKNSPIS